MLIPPRVTPPHPPPLNPLTEERDEIAWCLVAWCASEKLEISSDSPRLRIRHLKFKIVHCTKCRRRERRVATHFCSKWETKSRRNQARPDEGETTSISPVGAAPSFDGLNESPPPPYRRGMSAELRRDKNSKVRASSNSEVFIGVEKSFINYVVYLLIIRKYFFFLFEEARSTRFRKSDEIEGQLGRHRNAPTKHG